MSNNTCDICEMISKKDSFKLIYEDNDMICLLHEAPAFVGHSLLIPKQHFRIIEEVPEKLIGQMYVISNKISTSLFESLNIHGTNILINNGPDAGQSQPHFMINIIPRTENDGINLEWNPQKSDHQKLDSTYKFLKDYVDKVISGQSETKVIEKEDKPIKSDETDYLIKQFIRQP